MGNSLLRDVQYGIFYGDEKEGETQIIRHPFMINKELRKKSFWGFDNSWDGLMMNIKRGLGNKEGFGYRKKINKDKLDDKFTWLTYNQFVERAENFCRGLNVLNLCPEIETESNVKFRFLGIYSRNTIEWLIGYFGAARDSITISTIYDTLGEVAIEFILSQTKVETVLLEIKVVPRMCKIIKNGKGGNVKNLIVIDKEENPDVIEELKNLNINIYTCEEIENVGRQNGKSLELHRATADTICSLCYTSGTTGLPKGALISHGSICVETDVIEMLGLYLQDNDLYLSFLPYAHIMETLIMNVVVSRGVKLAIYNGNAQKLVEDMMLVNPTATCVVPRIFQRMYDGIMAEVKKESKLNQKIFNKAVESKIANFLETGSVKHAFWDTLVFNKVKKKFGGNLRFMLVGSAPMDDHILNFLRCVLSCTIVEGYGQTETCAGVLLTRTYDPITQHIGGPGFSAEMKLVDVPEMGYTSKDKDENGNWRPRGELCLRGPLLFNGYLNNEEKTKETIDKDGWLHSGDVAMILPEHGNAFKIIDRAKNMFKLQQGEYVAPEKIENILSNNEYVEQIFIYGDPLKNYLVSVLVPKRKTIIKYLQGKGIEVDKNDVEKYFDNSDLNKEILTSIDKFSRANDLKGFEIPKKVYLFKDAFTIENDLVTPTMKIKRFKAKIFFDKEIKQMYEE